MAIGADKRDFLIPDSGIDSVEMLNLGGIKQAILIQAVNPNNPILLFVHGGPCMPIPGVVSRGKDYTVATNTKNLVQHFVLVFWDQRGTGKSYDKHMSIDSFRVEQFISDCNELIDILRERFNQEKIYLAGHSWGSIIGLSIASQHPEKLHAYIGISQIIDWKENDILCYEWLKGKANAANDTKTLNKLEQLGKPPYLTLKQWTDFRTPLLKYKSMIYESDTIKHPGMNSVLKHFLHSPHYSFKDIFNTFYSSYKLTYTQQLIEDFAEVSFYSLQTIDVPVHFLHGRHDVHVDGNMVHKYFEEIETPNGKNMIWYEKSSHMFHPDDTRKIEEFLIQLVLTK